MYYYEYTTFSNISAVLYNNIQSNFVYIRARYSLWTGNNFFSALIYIAEADADHMAI